jgi:hypothetical protein
VSEKVPNNIDGQITISEYSILDKPSTKIYFPEELKTYII